MPIADMWRRAVSWIAGRAATIDRPALASQGHRRHRRAIIETMVLAAIVVPTASARAQSLLDIGFDGGVTIGGPADNRAPATDRPSVAWFGGVSVLTPRASMGRGWDFSVGAALRREPALGMVRTESAIVPAYLGAFAASAHLRFAHASGSFETAIVGRFAETRIDRGPRVTGRDVVRAANTIEDWSFLVDAVADVRWYGSRRVSAHGADRILPPTVRGFIGVKHDQRFHRAGDLQGFDDPTGRLEAGLFVTPWGRSNHRGVRVMAISAGGELETAIRGGKRLPSGFRVLVRAAIDPRRLK